MSLHRLITCPVESCTFPYGRVKYESCTNRNECLFTPTVKRYGGLVSPNIMFSMLDERLRAQPHRETNPVVIRSLLRDAAELEPYHIYVSMTCSSLFSPGTSRY